MDSKQLVLQELQEASRCYSDLASAWSGYAEELGKLADSVVSVLNSGKTIAFAGNGGSFADAQHMAAELTGKLNNPRRPLAAIVLGANSSSMSAIGNDFGFDEVFSRELQALGHSIGLVVAFTTSGKSSNITRLLECAFEEGILTAVFTGEALPAVGKTDFLINVPSSRTERVQEMHTTLGHLLCLLVERKMNL